MKNDALTIINHYGVSHQLKHLQTEIFELVEAIFQYEEQKRACEEFCSKLHCDKEKVHIAEEIADCYVLIEQFRNYYGISEEVIKHNMKFKIKRQLGRIENEDN